jgi:hypothetical protein
MRSFDVVLMRVKFARDFSSKPACPRKRADSQSSGIVAIPRFPSELGSRDAGECVTPEGV